MNKVVDTTNTDPQSPQQPINTLVKPVSPAIHTPIDLSLFQQNLLQQPQFPRPEIQPVIQHVPDHVPPPVEIENNVDLSHNVNDNVLNVSDDVPTMEQNNRKRRKENLKAPVVTEPEYEINKILKSRYKKDGSGLEYLISWKGFPASENSYEPWSNLNDTARKYVEEHKVPIIGKKPR